MSCNTALSKSKLNYVRRSVGQSVLVSGTPLGPATNYSPSFFIYLLDLQVCWCVAPSLTRGRVCSFHLLLGIASAVFLGSEFHGTHEHILLSLFLRLSQPGGCRPVRIKVMLRLTVSQCVLMSSPFCFSWPDVCYSLTVTVVSLWASLSDERSSLSFQYILHGNEEVVCCSFK
jgi:hypothetical protein